MEFAWASKLGILWIPTSVKEVDGEDQFTDETMYLLENYSAVSHKAVFRWEKSAQGSQMLARCIEIAASKRTEQNSRVEESLPSQWSQLRSNLTEGDHLRIGGSGYGSNVFVHSERLAPSFFLQCIGKQ
jgi:hypothetical protein